MDNERKNFDKIRRIYITVLFIAVMCIPFLFVLFGSPKMISLRENRALNQMPKFVVSQYFDHSFQEAVELGFQDQMMGSVTMKRIYNLIKRETTTTVYGVFAQVLDVFLVSDSVASGQTEETDGAPVLSPYDITDWGYTLTPLGDNIMRIEETGDLIIPSKEQSIWEPIMAGKIANMNDLASQFEAVRFNAYYIETDHDVNLIGYENTHGISTYMAEHLSDINFAVQTIDSLEDFDDFYDSDHHWNQNGQLKGYMGAVSLLGYEPNSLAQTVVWEDCHYVGSRARTLDAVDIYDPFGVAYIEGLEYSTTVNGEEKPYNNKQSYLDGDYETQASANHYAICCGYDVGLVTYDFDSPGKENLLMLTASFSNPINEMIASHFDQTYVVDLRHYEDSMGEAFDMAKFIETNDIDQVLYIGYYTYYALPEFLVPNP